MYVASSTAVVVVVVVVVVVAVVVVVVVVVWLLRLWASALLYYCRTSLPLSPSLFASVCDAHRSMCAEAC